MTQPATLIKNFPNGQRALAIRVDQDTDPATVIKALNLPQCRRLLMLSGGANHMAAEKMALLQNLFAAIGRMVVKLGVTVIDGGTEAGVMKLMGEALGRAGRTITPHIGVLPAHATVAADGTKAEDILDPNHSNFVLVEGDAWGSEVKQMYQLADYFSRQAPSIALLVNGGEIALEEVELNIRQGREIVVLVGSGRLADDIAQTLHHPARASSERVKNAAQAGQFILFNLEDSPDKLIALVESKLL
ncbi:MAG: hypothetical protein KDJ52_16930 [Anaerolineae bacterium]|nr:hypothetical protein [Anaerolineae bacterium]